MFIYKFLSVVLISLGLVATTAHALDEQEHYIVFGQTAALRGPAASLGKNMRDGLLAAFKEFNDRDDIQGKKIKLISYDDRYEPVKTIVNAKRLIEEDKVFALIGSVGTPTANALIPIINEYEMPLIGAFSGAEILRTPPNPYIVNFRSSYWQETEALVEYLVDDLKLKKISVLYQDDTYGWAGLTGVERALIARNIPLLSASHYRRNTLAVKHALLDIRAVNPDAVIMIGAYKPSAEFIKWAKRINFNPKLLNISFVGSHALRKELQEDAMGVQKLHALCGPQREP